MSEPKPPVPFFVPDIGDDEINEVVESLRNGWITTGAKARRFEEDFATYLGGGVECIAVNSATAGLHLALEALGVGPGDEVIVPDFTFTATAEVVRYLGADPVFVDVDEGTFNLCLDAVETKITPRTRAVIVVHFAGLPADMTGLLALADKHGLRVVEDAAHALPAAHKGQLIGTFSSDAAIFSFYANKTITTGEGGMVVTRNSAVAARCRVMRLHGIDRDAFDRFTATTVSWRYDVVAPGYKYNLTDIAAALGIHQLKKADAYQSRRAAVAARYDELLAGLPLILPKHADPGDLHAWHLYIVRVTAAGRLDRDGLMAALNDAGIKCSVHYTPLHRLTYWRERYRLDLQDFATAERVFESCLSLPLFPRMTDAQVERVAETLHRLLG